MAAVRHLGIVLPLYETTHEVCCWLQLPVKCHVCTVCFILVSAGGLERGHLEKIVETLSSNTIW